MFQIIEHLWKSYLTQLQQQIQWYSTDIFDIRVTNIQRWSYEQKTCTEFTLESITHKVFFLDFGDIWKNIFYILYVL